MRSVARPSAAYLFLLAGILLQGLSPVFTKLLLLQHLPQATIVASRYLLALVLFLPVVAVDRRPASLARPRRGDWIALVLVGVLGSGVAALLFTWALTYSAAGVVTALSKTAPLFVAVLAYLALQESVTPLRLALVAAMVAADALIGAGDFSVGGQEARQRLLGDLLALTAGLCRALSEVLSKGVLRRFTPSVVGAWRVGTGFAIAAVALAASGGGLAGLWALPAWGWAVLLALALVSTTGSLALYYRGLAHLPVHVAVALKLLSIIVTVAVSWFWLGEVLNLYHLTGVALLLGGAYLLVTSTPTPRPAAAPRPRFAFPLRERLGRVRVRLTVLAGLVIIAVVVPATYLMAAHAAGLVRRETRLAMSNVAVSVLNYIAAEPSAAPAVLERYLNNLVHSRLEDQTYSVDLVFALVQDRRGVVLAAAYDQQALELANPAGGSATRGEILAPLLALAADSRLAARSGIIVVQASLEDAESPVLATLGCARRAAGRLISQIVARHIAVALLIVATALASLWVVLGLATEPLTAVFRAVDQVSRGRLHYPVVSRAPDEVGRVAQSVDQIRLALGRGRRWRAVALRLLERSKADLSALPSGLVYMLLPQLHRPVRGREEAPDPRIPLLERIMEGEGIIEGAMESAILASWGREGPEQDDLLRAVLAGLAVAGDSRAVGVGPVFPLVSSRPEALVSDWRNLAQIPAGGDQPGLWLDAEDSPRLTEALAAGEFVIRGERKFNRLWLALSSRLPQEERGD